MTIVEIIGLSFGVGLLLFMFIGVIIARRKDMKSWNSGVCDSCYEGVWKSYACDSGGNAAYECTNCGTTMWENGYGSKVELDPDTPEDIWIKGHLINPSLMVVIKEYIKSNGKAQYILPFGAIVYSIHKMSTVVDSDCMDDKSEVDDILKYLILRSDGKLYTAWDDSGSLIF